VDAVGGVGDVEVKHGPDERQAPGLAGEPADHLGAALDLAQRSLEQVRASPPAPLILLDLHLPDLHGRDVRELLEQDAATAAIPVVIVSADATPGQLERLMAAGASDYLTKPIDVDELLKIITHALRPTSRELQRPPVGG
jgi:CheY-like chemotaxis protein